ncbi:MAG: methyltransferase domain-containing protein [Ramlibacter sp.]
MADLTLSEKLDTAWGDPGAWAVNGLQWTHLDEVRALINRRVSADPLVSPLGWFFSRLAATGALPLRRVLVLGCGSGNVEREIHENGWASQIVGFDLSPKVLEVARAAAAGIGQIEYVQASMDDIPVGQPPFLRGSFDAVIGVASVHHCSRLDKLYPAIAQLLAPDGWLFLDEYVGPERFQFSAEHMAHVTAVADLLPDWLLTTESGAVKRGFRAPTVAEVVAVDPSEAACSSQILPMLGEHFQVLALRPYGGGLLRVLLADVAQNFQKVHAAPWLQALLDTEEELDRLGLLEQHFSCAIARPIARDQAPPPA